MGLFDSTLGAVLLGFTAATFLFGVTCVQCFVYFQRYTDIRVLRFTIAFLWLVDTVHFCFGVDVVYYYLVTNFINVQALGLYRWSLAGSIILANTNDFFVRAFFTWRIYHLSKRNIPLTALLIGLDAVVTVLGIYYGARTSTFTFFAQLHDILWLCYTIFGLSVAADSFIAFILCYYLYTSKTGIQRTDHILSTLIIYSVNTGLITSVVSVLTLIAATVWPNTFINVAFYFPLSKLYLNSLLASLNAREALKGQTTLIMPLTTSSSHSGTVSQNTHAMSRLDKNQSSSGPVAFKIQVPTEISVQSYTTVSRDRDGMDRDKSSVFAGDDRSLDA